MIALLKTGSSQRSLLSTATSNLLAPLLLQHADDEMEYQFFDSDDLQRIVDIANDSHHVDQDGGGDDAEIMKKGHPVIFEIDFRECTGDSVLPLDEDIRLSSAEWQWDHHANEPSSSMHNKTIDCVNKRPTILLELKTLLKEPMAISSRSWVVDDDDDEVMVGPVVPSMVFPEPSTVSSVPSTPGEDEKPKKKRTRPPRRFSADAVEPTDHDILFGRGGSTNNHPGNVHFRQVALELRSWYELANSKAQKRDISMDLLQIMKNENRRFLEKLESDGLWHEVEDDGARWKASQALRERLNL